MSDADPGDRHVQGERDRVLGLRAPAQSRVGNALAIGLMSALGLGSLVWYYASAMMRTGRAKEHAQAVAAQRAQGDLPLPSLGRIGAPPLPDAFDPVSPGGGPAPAARTLAEIPLAPTGAEMAGAPPPKTPEQLAQERELSGSVFSARDAMPSPVPAAPMPSIPEALTPGGSARGDGDLGSLLRPSATASARARMLPAQRLLMPKGAFIDCTLESAIDSSLPGMTTCVTATDTFGVDGKVVLMERGTKLTGETRGQVQQGASRLFVLWTEARTPAGVVVPLDSPGADALGRSGLPGEVDRHFWQRFGAAILVSVIDGAVQAAAQSPRGESGAVIVNPSASQDVLTEILKNTISIPPTVVKKNGDRIQVLVARDLDFRPVYELRSRESAR
jgi:type IV secretion system protein VirB10